MKTIKLTKGKEVLVDDEDYDFLNQWKWYASHYSNLWYAQRTDYSGNKKKTIKMHRIILNAPKNLVVDHIDRNGLNNQKFNIRICTQKENSNNRNQRRSKVIYKFKNKWHNKIVVNLGGYETEEEAIKEYINLSNKIKNIMK